MRRFLLFTIAVVVVARPLNAQIAVYDPANTARNTITATLQGVPARDRSESSTPRSAEWRGGSASSPTSRRFVVPDTPRWRTHGGDFLYANGINDALIFGDPAGCRLPRGEPSGGERESPPR